MMFVLKLVGWLLLGCVAVYLAALVVAFGMGVVESIRYGRKRRQRRAVRQEKRDEGKATFRVVWPE